MPVEVIMPKVDMDMASGKIAIWHVAVGEAVEKGTPLFDMETDKAAMEVEAPADGILQHAAPEGSDIQIGTPCAWLYAAEETVGAQPAPFAWADGTAPGVAAQVAAADDADDLAASETAEADGPIPDIAPNTDKPRASPKARKLAAEAGVALEAVAGSGPRGRVMAEDIRAIAEARQLPVSAPPVAFAPETGPLAISRRSGGDGVPLVMLHGFASDALSFSPLADGLRQHPVIRIDLPCHGKSPHLLVSSFADLVAQVRRAVDGLGLPAMHLIGHSLGGAVALALADTRPRQLSALTLIAPAGLGPEINGPILSGICRATRAESLAPWLRSLVADEGLITDSYARLAMAARADPNLRAGQSALAEVLFPDGVQAFDLRAALGRVAAPTQIIWGKQDAILPWSHALRAPGEVALHLFDQTGHMPQIERAEAVAKLIARAPTSTGRTA